jgi:apolipoprotein N-acyltransferase
VVVALRRHHCLLLAILGGVVFALTSPPTDLYPAVIVGLALLAASLAGPVIPKKTRPDAPTPPEPGTMAPPRGKALPLSFFRAFGRGAAWGTAAGIVGLRFVPSVIQRFTPLGSAASYLALVLLAAAQALVWAIGAGITAFLHRRARVPFELAFAIGVFVAVSLPTIFAWTPAGLVSPWPAFVELADVIGERGVSAVFAVGAALICRAVLALSGRAPGKLYAPMTEVQRGSSRAAALRPAAAAAALFALLPIYGSLRIRSITRAGEGLPAARIGLVNHAVGPHARWDPKNHAGILRKLHELTHGLEEQGVELTIWPEAAYPYILDHDTRHAPRGPRAILDKQVHGPIVVGLITHDRPVSLPNGDVEINTYNSAALVLPSGAMTAPYDKLELLWFGEMVPGGAHFPWLRRIFQKSGGLVPGAEPRALELPRDSGPDLRMGVLNCYEDTLANVGRRIATELRPNLLVNVTNDAWFFGTAEPELHARLAAMRAIELRRDLVRAVNMGVTSWIDAAGVVRMRYADDAPAALSVTPLLRDDNLTLYARLGDAPLPVLFALTVVASVWRARQRPALGAPERGLPPALS